MKFSIFGCEVEICREKDGPPYNRWHCPSCGEDGWFHANPGRAIYYPSGDYDWKSFPEMRCECRRHHEEASK